MSSARISPCAFFVLSSRPVYSTAERSTGRFKLFYLLLMSGRVGLGRVLRYVVTLRYVTLCRVVSCYLRLLLRYVVVTLCHVVLLRDVVTSCRVVTLRCCYVVSCRVVTLRCCYVVSCSVTLGCCDVVSCLVVLRYVVTSCHVMLRCVVSFSFLCFELWWAHLFFKSRVVCSVVC